MLEAFGWGALAASSLVLGGVAALRLPISDRALGLIMAFGGGVLISAVAYAFIQRERMHSHAGPPLTFPQARAFVQEIFTGLLFISRPRYMQWMKQAEQRFHQLRI